jgi:hypothetical protein
LGDYKHKAGSQANHHEIVEPVKILERQDEIEQKEEKLNRGLHQNHP